MKKEKWPLIIPVANNIQARFNTKKLKKALLSWPCSEKDHKLELEISSGYAMITRANTAINIATATHIGEDIKIVLDYKSLLDILDTIKGTRVEMTFRTPDSTVVILEPGNNNKLDLLTPIIT